MSVHVCTAAFERLSIVPVLQVGMIYVNVSSAVRICQGSEIVIKMADGIQLPVQVLFKPKGMKWAWWMYEPVCAARSSVLMA